MLLVHGDCLTEIIQKCIFAVLQQGRRVAPRGLSTLEIRPATIILSRPANRVVCLPGRNVSPCFAAAETLWILSGSDAPWIFDFNPALRRYANDGILKGAYGPRLRNWAGFKDQLEWVLEVLRNDRDSRRAVIQVFDPHAVHLSHSDIPCTLGFRFFVRDEKLHMHTSMRANDVWLGMPYDIFCFTSIQEILAFNLGIPMGEYIHMVDSLHIYDHQLEIAERVVETPSPYLDEQFTTQHPLLVPIDSLTSEVRSIIEVGRSPAKLLSEHTCLINMYRSIKGVKSRGSSCVDTDALSVGLKKCLDLWLARS